MSWKIFFGISIPLAILILALGLSFIGGDLKIKETNVLTEINASNIFSSNYEGIIIKTLKITNSNPFFSKNYNVPAHVACFSNEAEDQFQVVYNTVKKAENSIVSNFYIGGEENLEIPSKSSKFTDLTLNVAPNSGYSEQYTKLLVFETAPGAAYSACNIENIKNAKKVQKIKIIPRPTLINAIIDINSFNCTDSDSGLDYYAYGITTGKQKDNVGIIGLPDSCYYSGTELNGKLGENYCDSNNLIQTEVYMCPNGCSNGACQQPQITCTDSDSGLDYYTYGIASLSNGENISDMCIGNGKLQEVYCNSSINGLLAWIDYDCAKGCMSNKCIS